jgi:hypothetical protein
MSDYPDAPGYKRDGTSAEAADAVQPKAQLLRAMILVQLQRMPLTADECADRMNRSILSVRPRFSELERLGHIRDSGARRRNVVSGHRAIVWELKPDA